MFQTYDTTQQQEYQAQANAATLRNLRAAATYLSNRFRERHITIAIMGGFPIVLRGSRRRTHDVDIAIGSSMGAVRQALQGEQRVILPAGPVSGVMRIFVKTGGQWDESSDQERVVEADLISAGHLGAPENVEAATEILNIPLFPTPLRLPVVDLLSILKAKLAAYSHRGALNDLTDLAWLLERYRTRIVPLRNQLDSHQRRRFIQGATGAHLPDINKMKQTLGVH